MNKGLKILSVIMILCMLFVLCGCSKSEDFYKDAIEEHMSKEHGSSVDSYQEFEIEEDGSVRAEIFVTAGLEDGGSIAGMHAKLTLDEEGHIRTCSWCDLGI